MTLKWTDTFEIAVALEEKFPEIDNINLRFTDLHKWILDLDGFQDDPNKSNEKILESIQIAWLEQRD